MSVVPGAEAMLCAGQREESRPDPGGGAVMQEKTTPNIIIKLLNTNNKEKILKELEEKIHRIQMNKLQMISCQKFCKTEDKVVTSLKF